MGPEALRALLQDVASGNLTPEAAAGQLADLPFQSGQGFMADTHRPLRTGESEAVYCAGKTPEQAAAAFAALARSGGPVLATRATDSHAAAIVAAVPGAVRHPQARMVVFPGPQRALGRVAVVCAGTSDLPVADEAAVTAEALGASVSRLDDVGVAGLHRVLSHAQALRQARVLIVVAGMEGALPAVVAGLAGAPVVAVPTSVGYGASFGGLAALLAMLNACAPGVGVVNIDNGFGAAVLALRILRSGADGP